MQGAGRRACDQRRSRCVRVRAARRCELSLRCRARAADGIRDPGHGARPSAARRHPDRVRPGARDALRCRERRPRCGGAFRGDGGAARRPRSWASRSRRRVARYGASILRCSTWHRRSSARRRHGSSRLIAIDLDGTLLHSDRTVSARTRAAHSRRPAAPAWRSSSRPPARPQHARDRLRGGPDGDRRLCQRGDRLRPRRGPDPRAPATYRRDRPSARLRPPCAAFPESSSAGSTSSASGASPHTNRSAPRAGGHDPRMRFLPATRSTGPSR